MNKVNLILLALFALVAVNHVKSSSILRPKRDYDTCMNGGIPPYCCANRSPSPYCCANGSPSPYCCANGSMREDCDPSGIGSYGGEHGSSNPGSGGIIIRIRPKQY